LLQGFNFYDSLLFVAAAPVLFLGTLFAVFFGILKVGGSCRVLRLP
jgi:hypothetical protein